MKWIEFSQNEIRPDDENVNTKNGDFKLTINAEILTSLIGTTAVH